MEERLQFAAHLLEGEGVSDVPSVAQQYSPIVGFLEMDMPSG
ncbi:hypothetical protein [Rhizobium mayense]|uniref:Uncharacterized protein n=1 Tax=Rhizobium mayense TaxID=1312184 RepID=A0ABT7K3C1_9HYPH|nr:hypothetical protein [Rhizobium mayense]MDL2403101.1 hypothetical protein [Rhizobium mayense]